MKSHIETIDELKFWNQNFDKFHIRFLSPTYCPPVRGSLDANNTGLAAKVFIDSKLNTVYKNFSIEEKNKNSTWRELYAVYYSLLTLAPYLHRRTVEWQTDNYATSLIVEKGSTNRVTITK